MKRIFIVDDDPIAAAMDRDKYLRAGYQVRKCDGCAIERELKLPYRLYTTELIPPKEDGGNMLCYGPLVIHKGSHSVFLHGHKVELRVKEYDILIYLAERPNQVVSRSVLYRAVWNEEIIGSDATITEHIRRLRAKIEAYGEPRHIETVWRQGYRFCA